MNPRIALIAAACAAFMLWGCGESGTSAPVAAALLRHSIGAHRLVEPRLSLGDAYESCATRTPLCRAGFTTLRTDLHAVAAAIRSAPMSEQERLTAGATLELVTSLESGNDLDGSVSLFESAAEAMPTQARGWSDLAAAYLVRSEATGNAADAFRAIQAGERAAELAPTDVRAGFNLALALDHLGLRRSALNSWESYERMDPHSGWGDEARAHAKCAPLSPRRRFDRIVAGTARRRS